MKVTKSSALAILVLKVGVLAQTLPPKTGIQLGEPDAGLDLRFPLVVTQCEPVLIYYNLISERTTSFHFLFFMAPDNRDTAFFTLEIPTGVGYLEWICDIPAGHGFIVGDSYFIVQPSRSSSCLGNITTTYDSGDYDTTAFRSYTQNSNTIPSPSLSSHTTTTIPFPTDSFSTITVNPDLAIGLQTSTLSVTTSSAIGSASSVQSPSVQSSPVASSPHPVPSAATSPRKSNTYAIAGGVIGGIAILLLSVILVFVLLRRHRKIRRQEPVADPFVTVSERKVDSGLMTTSLSPLGQVSQSGSKATSDKESPVLQSDLEAQTTRIQPHVPHLAGSNSSSASGVLTVVTGLDPVTPSSEPTPQTDEPEDSQSDLALAVDIVSRMRPNASQREMIITSLNTTIYPESGSSPSVPAPQLQAELTPGTEPQDESSEMAVALNSITRLNPEERRAFVATLNNLFAPGTSEELSRRDSGFPEPPAYDG